MVSHADTSHIDQFLTIVVAVLWWLAERACPEIVASLPIVAVGDGNEYLD